MLPSINYKHNFFYFNKLLEIGYSETNPFIETITFHLQTPLYPIVSFLDTTNPKNDKVFENFPKKMTLFLGGAVRQENLAISMERWPGYVV
jgi:hypothetical protein